MWYSPLPTTSMRYRHRIRSYHATAVAWLRLSIPLCRFRLSAAAAGHDPLRQLVLDVQPGKRYRLAVGQDEVHVNVVPEEHPLLGKLSFVRQLLKRDPVPEPRDPDGKEPHQPEGDAHGVAEYDAGDQQDGEEHRPERLPGPVAGYRAYGVLRLDGGSRQVTASRWGPRPCQARRRRSGRRCSRAAARPN